jgi:hypothetical protein
MDYNEVLKYLTPLAPFLQQKKYGNQAGGGFDAGSLISLLLSFYAAFLAYECSRFETPAMRLFYTIVAFLFGGLYLIYYFVFRYLMGNRCF